MTTSPDANPAAEPSRAGPHTVRVVLTGDLDYDTSDALLHQVQRALRGHEDPRELRLDCGKLGMVDSMGLSTLLQIHRWACQDGISFHLDNIGPILGRLLELTGVYEYLTTPQQAVPKTDSR